MHTTVDEQLAVTDPRVTEQEHRSEFLIALGQAYEFDGLPVPDCVIFSCNPERVQLRMDDAQTGDVDSWATHLGLERVTRTDEFVHSDNNGRLWRSYRVEHTRDRRWHGYCVEVWAVAYLTDDEAAAYRAQQAEGS